MRWMRRVRTGTSCCMIRSLAATCASSLKTEKVPKWFREAQSVRAARDRRLATMDRASRPRINRGTDDPASGHAAENGSKFRGPAASRRATRHSALEEPVLRPRQAEIFAQGPPFILFAENP